MWLTSLEVPTDMPRQTFHTAIDSFTFRLLTDWDFAYDHIENMSMPVVDIVRLICQSCGYDFYDMLEYMGGIPDPYNCLGIIEANL